MPSLNTFFILPQFFQYGLETPWPGSLSIPSYPMTIPVPFFFRLTSFTSFIFNSTITMTDPIYLRQFWVVF